MLNRLLDIPILHISRSSSLEIAIREPSSMMINFASLTESCSSLIFGQTLFCVYLWRCLCMRLTCKWTDWVKGIALPNMGGPCMIINGLDRTKGSKTENSLCLAALKLEYWLFPAFGHTLKHWLFLGLKTAVLDWNYSVGSPESPACWLHRSWDFLASIVA